ncbi:MAG: glycosyltransferase family 9 protein [Bacteroidota bacterium]
MKVYTFLIKLQYAWLNACLSLFQQSLFGAVNRKATKILLVRKGNLGDIICSFPAFESIKKYFPSATIDLLTTHGTLSSMGASSVIPNSYFHKVFEFRSFTLKSLWSLLRKQQYDTVIELPADVETFGNQLRNMVFFRLAGIEMGGGWTVTRTNFLPKKQLKYFHFDNEQERLKKILNSCGIPSGVLSYPPLFTQEDLNNIQDRFTGMSSEKMVAIAVGAKLDKKKWPLSYVRAVVEYLHQHKYRVVAIGDEGDYHIVESLAIPAIANYCGKLTVAESAALLSLCTFTVCNDSGPMHLSYAVETPVYAIFSARNYPGKWNPPSDNKNKLFVNYNVPCAGCMNIPCDDNVCMKQITPEQVIQSIHITLHT